MVSYLSYTLLDVGDIGSPRIGCLKQLEGLRIERRDGRVTALFDPIDLPGAPWVALTLDPREEALRPDCEALYAGLLTDEACVAVSLWGAYSFDFSAGEDYPHVLLEERLERLLVEPLGSRKKGTEPTEIERKAEASGELLTGLAGGFDRADALDHLERCRSRNASIDDESWRFIMRPLRVRGIVFREEDA